MRFMGGIGCQVSDPEMLPRQEDRISVMRLLDGRTGRLICGATEAELQAANE